MTALELLVYTALSGCAIAGAIRVALGPSLADRVAALDVMLVALMAGIAADAGFRRDATNLDLIVVIAIVGFTATVAASRYIEHEAGSAANNDVTLPGGQPHLPGGQPHLPGGQPHLPGGQPHLPGGQPHLPGGQPHLPGGQP